jgi:predicted esterase
MNPKRALFFVVLAAAIAGIAFFAWRTGPSSAPSDSATATPIQAPIADLPTLSAPDHLDRAQLDVISASIRRQASAVNAQEALQLPKAATPLSPLFAEPIPTAAMVQQQLISPKEGQGAPSPNSSAPAPAAPAAMDTAKQSSSNPAPLFNPYPLNPEPAIPKLPTGHHPQVPVLAPGRLDWTFVASHQSLDREPSTETSDYDSTQQTYELFVPPSYDPRRFYPMIIHVSPGSRSGAWGIWQTVAQQHDVIIAGAHNAGNDVEMGRRCRIVLDVLDDVRRRFRIDPDRTYISGTSGGGNAASRVAFALPELFGGAIPIVGTWNLRLEPMVRRRVRERLSVAVLTGERDFNRNEMEREFYPVLAAHQVRARLWVYPGIGHAVPNPRQLDEVFHWVEAGLPERRALATLFPVSRLVNPLTPAAWSAALVLEAGERLKLPPGTSSGLFILQGVAERWKGLPAASDAERLLHEFDAQSPVPWKKIYRAELLRFRYLQATEFDGIINGPLPADYPVPRSNLTGIARYLWNEILDLAPPNSSVATEAQNRLAALKKEKR